MQFKRGYIHHTRGEVIHEDGPVQQPSALYALLGVSNTSMDVDPSSVSGETKLNAYMQVQQVSQRHGPTDVVDAAPARVPSENCIEKKNFTTVMTELVHFVRHDLVLKDKQVKDLIHQHDVLLETLTVAEEQNSEPAGAMVCVLLCWR